MATMGFIKTEIIEDIQVYSNPMIVPENFTHAIAFGETGCGKTSSFIYPNLQKRMNLGHGVLLYDYKGKEHLSVKLLAHQSGRLKDVVEIGKPWGENINLIQKMDEDELDKFFDNILKHGDENKYWQNSAKSLGQLVLRLLKGIESFSLLYEKVTSKNLEVIDTVAFDYPTRRTLNTLLQVSQTFEKLKNFIKGLASLDSAMESLIQEYVVEMIQNGKDPKKESRDIARLIESVKRVKETIKIGKNAFESFGEDSNENLTQNIIGSLVSPLVSIAQERAFNLDTFDIVSALNEGKIIVVNVESLSNAVVEALNNTVLYELSKRTKSTNIHPVSVFIDEAQRVMSENADIPIDVFREAKVEMFLATQNSALLKEKLKDEKFDALMGNLTRKYYYRSSTDEELESAFSLKELKDFTALCSVDGYESEYLSKPVFLDLSKRLQSEFMYQKRLTVLERYVYKLRDKTLIAQYDARLFKDGKLLLIEPETQKEHTVDIHTKEQIEELQKELLELFSRAQKKVADTQPKKRRGNSLKKVYDDPMEEMFS